MFLRAPIGAPLATAPTVAGRPAATKEPPRHGANAAGGVRYNPSMRRRKRGVKSPRPAEAIILVVIGVASAIALAWPLAADDAHDRLVEKLHQGDYSRRGADGCLGCHDEAEPFPTLSIFKTVHGHPAVPGSPFETAHALGGDASPLPAGLQCEACHGPSGEHDRRILPAGVDREPVVNFGVRANARAALQNGLCLQCHADYGRVRWGGSAHEQADLACADCHRLHDATDPVRHHANQNRVCTTCHRDVAADALKLSAHPLRDSQLICRDCHDPHGTDSERLNVEASASATCLACHTEKRGPFLWEHPPVVEDCMTCHVPHGANQPALLVRRAPQLCQGCHSSVGHRSLARDADDLPPRPASVFLLAKACLNCHSEIHGSNHPSGNWFRR